MNKKLKRNYKTINATELFKRALKGVPVLTKEELIQKLDEVHKEGKSC